MKAYIAPLDPREDAAREANHRLIEALARHESVATPEAGAILFDRAESPAGVYVLLDGSVEMVFGEAAHKPIFLSVPGTILGLNAVVSDRPLDYTAKAAEGTVVGWVPKSTFFGVLERTPALWMDVLKVLSRDVGSCYDRVRELAEHGHNAARHVATGRVHLMA